MQISVSGEMSWCPGWVLALLSPSKSWRLCVWQKSQMSGQAVLCSVNESWQQACTDHTRNWRRETHCNSEENLFVFQCSNNLCLQLWKRRTWKFLCRVLHSSVGVWPWGDVKQRASHPLQQVVKTDKKRRERSTCHPALTNLPTSSG